MPQHRPHGLHEFQGLEQQLDDPHVTVVLPAHVIHGRDPARLGGIDIGVGHQEELRLLDGLLSQNFARLHVQIRGGDSRTLQCSRPYR
jgi:hypothetical protein